MNIGENFEAFVLDILRGIAGFDVTAGGTDDGADIIIEYDDKRVKGVVQVKTRADAATAHQIVRLAKASSDTPLLFIAGRTTAGARTILRDGGVAFVDGLGNAELELPGLIYRVVGSKKPLRSPSPTRLSGKAGRVAQTLLQDPQRGWHINELAQATDVSAGFVHRVLTRLGEQELLSTEGAGPARTRSVTEPGALLDLWAEEQSDKVTRTRCYQLAQTHQQLLDQLGQALATANIDYAVTGMAGADLVAPFVSAVTETELWVKATTDPAQLVALPQVEPVEAGQNLTFLQAQNDDVLMFRRQIGDTWVANNMRLYIDLHNDPRRGAEQAAHLRKQVIGF